ncbi:MAG TPA: SirB2 family protein [Burkholderiales bacterium]|nr:SirB2 family protein [Burkholderiales bacterium]
MVYLIVKQVHVLCAALSIAGFALRGVLMLRDSALLQSRIARAAPHVVDTLLLASAVVLSWQSAQYPFAQGWLTAKLLALVAYIVLGTVALKRGRTKGVRAAALALALLAAFYIVSVAVTRDPAGFLRLG